jgi:hypothetical protein
MRQCGLGHVFEVVSAFQEADDFAATIAGSESSNQLRQLCEILFDQAQRADRVLSMGIKTGAQ